MAVQCSGVVEYLVVRIEVRCSVKLDLLGSSLWLE